MRGVSKKYGSRERDGLTVSVTLCCRCFVRVVIFCRRHELIGRCELGTDEIDVGLFDVREKFECLLDSATYRMRNWRENKQRAFSLSFPGRGSGIYKFWGEKEGGSYQRSNSFQ